MGSSRINFNPAPVTRQYLPVISKLLHWLTATGRACAAVTYCVRD